jgi:ribonuclease P protein component
MLPVLRTRRDFLRVQARGVKLRGRLLILLCAEGELSTTRLGLTVSRKVGNAVCRNRVRRRLREIMRLHGELHRAGVDYVIVALPDAARAGFIDLREELTWLLTRAHASILHKPC